ncbi:MAG: NAD(P)H-binding protein [Chloroflexi bacterium]|nr:NAD(P)H-binding protein [Chloroflexota bacterium]
MRVAAGQVADATAVAQAIEGANAVISAPGPDGDSVDEVVMLRHGKYPVINAMEDHGVRRNRQPVGGSDRRPQGTRFRDAGRYTRTNCRDDQLIFTGIG